MGKKIIDCEFEKEACLKAVSDLQVEAQETANLTGVDTEIEYQLKVKTHAGQVQFYKVENATPVRITENECGVIKAIATVEELTTEDETLEDLTVVFEEEAVEVVVEEVETNTEPVSAFEVETETNTQVKHLEAEVDRLNAENAELREEVESLQTANDKVLLEYANGAKKLFKKLDDLNSEAKNYR